MIRRTRIILHVDVDAFFPSVEQVLRPELRGRPVIVGGRCTDRSVVASASYEARAFGVKTAMPIAAAHRLCPDGIFLRGNFHEYQAFSRRVEHILNQLSPDVQQLSLDDFYIDITGIERLHGPPFAAADRFKRRIKDETGLNVSMGIAGSKLVAKIASEQAKPNGIAEIKPGHERAFLRPLPVDELPGVGRRTLAALQRFNLHTIGDLARMDPRLLEQTFGVHGAHMARHARGEDNSAVLPCGPVKSISRETTFEEDVAERRLVESMLYYLTERAAAQLRENRQQARCVTVKVRYPDFQTVSRSRTLDRPTDHDAIFYREVQAMARRLLERRMQVRLVGVCLSLLVEGVQRQRDFLEGATYDKRSRLYGGVDRVREKFGFSALVIGPSLHMLGATERDEHGFKLKTSCLSR